jgi:tetratricopeptide (TPR) repeat protein
MNSCDDVRPLLAAFDDGELSREERDSVLVHLAGCAACDAALRRERELTDRLVAGRAMRARRFGGRVPWLAGLAAAALVVVALLPTLTATPRAFGHATIAPAAPPRVGATPPQEELGRVALEGVAPRTFALRASNHFVVVRGERLRVLLADVGQLDAEGPARFELEQGEPRWKLVLLTGDVAADLAANASLFVVAGRGEKVVAAGRHALSPEKSSFAAEVAADATPAELLQQGHTDFFQREEFVAAEALYRRAADHSAATAKERDDALFYWAAAIARQERWADALAANDEVLQLSPDHPSRGFLHYYAANYLVRLGRLDDARARYQQAIAVDPAGEAVVHAKAALVALDMTARPEPGAPIVAVPTACVVPARAPRGGVKVVALGLDPKRSDDRAMLAVAAAAAKFHKTPLVELPLAGTGAEGYEDGLRAAMLQDRPRALLLFVAPRDLDVNLHRRTLLLATKLDADPFVDCAFGWMTARDGAALEAFWKRTQELRQKGLSSRRWVSPFVMSQGPSQVWPEWGGELQRAAGYETQGLGYATIEHDAKVLDFAAAHWRDLESAGVLAFTGNGDPQGIWLFDDQRNLDASRHWPFDPAKVGHDPDRSMPRLLAADYAKLKLARPLVWSGTCHSAAVGRVFVEGDIVSTFGVTERVTPFELPAGTSLALAWLDAGATALMAPIAANHGYSVDLEEEFALTTGAPLGEIVKSTWDDVVGAAGGELRLALPVAGQPFDHGEPIMQGGGANRLLIGDPTLAPFEAIVAPNEEVTVVKRGADRFDVIVRWAAGWHTRTWDLYGEDRARDGRIAARIDLDKVLGDGAAKKLSAKVNVAVDDSTEAERKKGMTGDGEMLPFVLTRVLAEEFHGRRWLHLQANAPRKVMEGKALVATFEVSVAKAESE